MQSLYSSIKISRDDFKESISKKASTLTFGQIAVIYGDICPRAILSVPFWRWIGACASTSFVSPSTRHTAWLPWRPVAPAVIHWLWEETIHDKNVLKRITAWSFDFQWPTFTNVQITVLCWDICPRTIQSVPFWRWIRAATKTCPFSPSTRYITWLP